MEEGRTPEALREAIGRLGGHGAVVAPNPLADAPPPPFTDPTGFCSLDAPLSLRSVEGHGMCALQSSENTPMSFTPPTAPPCSPFSTAPMMSTPSPGPTSSVPSTPSSHGGSSWPCTPSPPPESSDQSYRTTLRPSPPILYEQSNADIPASREGANSLILLRMELERERTRLAYERIELEREKEKVLNKKAKLAERKRLLASEQKAIDGIRKELEMKLMREEQRAPADLPDASEGGSSMPSTSHEIENDADINAMNGPSTELTILNGKAASTNEVASVRDEDTPIQTAVKEEPATSMDVAVTTKPKRIAKRRNRQTVQAECAASASSPPVASVKAESNASASANVEHRIASSTPTEQSEAQADQAPTTLRQVKIERAERLHGNVSETHEELEQASAKKQKCNHGAATDLRSTVAHEIINEAEQMVHSSAPLSASPDEYDDAHPAESDPSTSNEATPMTPPLETEKQELIKNEGDEYEEEEPKCHQCGITKARKWRRGPAGPCTLCDICGKQFEEEEEESSQQHREKRKRKLLSTKHYKSRKRKMVRHKEEENTPGKRYANGVRDEAAAMRTSRTNKKLGAEIPNYPHRPSFGPIVDVDIGDWFPNRIIASKAGVHRPWVAGIHGKSDVGCYSIVLNGNYEDDVDSGTSFLYTGSGGRELKEGNRRTAPQTMDQPLNNCNSSLIQSCKAKLPVRVLRGRRAGKYAPADGYRYDGLYYVTKYWQETGQSGFKVWRFKFTYAANQTPPWEIEGYTENRERWDTKHGLTRIESDSSDFSEDSSEDEDSSSDDSSSDDDEEGASSSASWPEPVEPLPPPPRARRPLLKVKAERSS